MDKTQNNMFSIKRKIFLSKSILSFDNCSHFDGLCSLTFDRWKAAMILNSRINQITRFNKQQNENEARHILTVLTFQLFNI